MGTLLIKIVSPTNAGTVTFTAGVKPPSMRADLGTLAISMAADDVKYVVVEAGRFTQTDGTTDGIISGAGADTMLMAAFRLPRTV